MLTYNILVIYKYIINYKDSPWNRFGVFHNSTRQLFVFSNKYVISCFEILVVGEIGQSQNVTKSTFLYNKKEVEKKGKGKYII